MFPTPTSILPKYTKSQTVYLSVELSKFYRKWYFLLAIPPVEHGNFASASHGSNTPWVKNQARHDRLIRFRGAVWPMDNPRPLPHAAPTKNSTEP